MYKRLESIYIELEDGEEFRHYYSDIFVVLSDIDTNPEKGDIDVIGQNLYIIKKGYDPEKAEHNVCKNINKLFDHVSLEIARIRYSEFGDREVSNQQAIIEMKSKLNESEDKLKDTDYKLKETEEKIKDMLSKVDGAESRIKNAEEEIEKQQRDYIAILGIFASIVISFVAGISFSTSTLANIQNVGAYKLIIIICLLGLFIISALFSLFYYIDRLTIGGVKKEIKPLIVIYAVFIIIMIATVIAWWFGLVERRNQSMILSGLMQSFLWRLCDGAS